MSTGSGPDFSRAVGSSIAWSFVDKWLSRAFSLAVFVVLGRLLAPSEFGAVALATAYVAFLTIFVEAGLGAALVRRPSLSPGDIGTAFVVSAAAGFAFSAGGVALATPIALMFGSPETAPVLRVMSIALILHGFASIPAALLERDLDFRALAIRRSIATAASGVGAIVAALYGLGVWSLVIQSLGFAVIGCILSILPVWRRLRIGFSARSLRELWDTSIGVFGTQFVTFINSQADRLIVGAFLGVEALGQYFFAMRIIALTMELFTAVFSNVGLSAFARLQAEPPRLLSLLYRMTGVTSIATVPIFAAIGAFATVIVPFVFGPQWESAIPLLQILVFLGALNSLLIFDRSVLVAVGKSTTAFWLSVGQAAMGVALLLVAAPFGLTWIAIAVVARQYAFWPVRLLVLKRVIGYSAVRYLSAWLIAMLGLFLSWGAAWCLQALWPQAGQPWTAFALFVVLYALVYMIGARRTLSDALSVARSILRR